MMEDFPPKNCQKNDGTVPVKILFIIKNRLQLLLFSCRIVTRNGNWYGTVPYGTLGILIYVCTYVPTVLQ